MKFLKTETTTKITRIIGKIGLRTKEKSPVILAVVGTIGIGVGIYTACKATLKVEGIVDETKKKITKCEDILTNPECIKVGYTYTDEDCQNDIKIIKRQGYLQILKAYSIPTLVTIGSIACFISGNRILTKRNTAMVAAYTAVDKAYKELRKNIRDEFGEEKEMDLVKGLRRIAGDESQESRSDTPDNSMIKLDNQIQSQGSPYARIFDEFNAPTMWTRTPGMNLTHLILSERWANEKLERDGYLILNDLYAQIGLEKCTEGQVVGWIYDNEDGLHHVDIGISKLIKKYGKELMAQETNFALDFNVDGVIYDRCFKNK